jgi:hypothetical protein
MGRNGAELVRDGGEGLQLKRVVPNGNEVDGADGHGVPCPYSV